MKKTNHIREEYKKYISKLLQEANVAPGENTNRFKRGLAIP
jgi:dTDP-4-amino-4,6-dideoxygalactose transaminase